MASLFLKASTDDKSPLTEPEPNPSRNRGAFDQVCDDNGDAYLPAEHDVQDLVVSVCDAA